tara:strand:+ start:159 stop:1382 length:1224 start_codon:yes stop_codon:yes gene_type:complete
MASSRDDFIIAIRSAFLKKSTQQKFSLLTLVLISVFIIVFSNFDLKIIRYLKAGISEVVYRSSFVVSIPENILKSSYLKVSDYSTFYKNYLNDKEELNYLRSKDISNEITKFENKELKELINDYVYSSDKILAKIIVDHKSPYLRSVIINKGSKDNIKIGTNIYDQSYLVGRVIEVNFKTSRVLLLSDLNSNIPVTIVPQNIQAIVTGSGENFGQIKYIKDTMIEDFTEESTVYTSGTGAIFKSGVPIGKLRIINNDKVKKYNVEFYSDFSQIKYVFAEVASIKEIKQPSSSDSDANKTTTPLNAKLKILEDEIKIIEGSNLKLIEKNESLKTEISNLNNKITNFQSKISSQNKKIEEFDIDTQELEFLRLNLSYGPKCRKTFINNNGFLPGTEEYRNCVINRGRKN